MIKICLVTRIVSRPTWVGQEETYTCHSIRTARPARSNTAIHVHNDKLSGLKMVALSLAKVSEGSRTCSHLSGLKSRLCSSSTDRFT